jgi:hypothetical protein
MGTDSVSVVDTGLPDQISGPPRGRGYASMSVAMLRAIIEGQSALPPRWFFSNGHCLNLFAAWYREARAMAPRAPLSSSIWVHELVAAEQ